MGARTMAVGRQVRESSPDAERVSAFQDLADRTLLASYRLANAILGDTTEAQDAVHDAVVTAWQRWGSLRDPAKFQAWFQRIVVNTCRDRLRRSARRRTTDIAAQTSLTTPDASKEIHDRIQVEQALALLKPDDRIMLALRHYHDLTIEDIARLLDIPASTANSRLRSARLRLRSALEPTHRSGASR